jgi:5,10-methylene-tetrahydrofolate dehydrogenase/methenyl tetrahydrofolate cyclohydrolase
MRFFYEHLPGDVEQQTVLDVLQRLNADKQIHGIILQLPVPPQLNEKHLLECINPSKDVDGLHPNNVGRLAMRGIWRPAFVPCAPLGCMELLRRENIPIQSKSVAVIGDSNVVGMPMSWLLRDAGASSVTVIHSHGVKHLKQTSSFISCAEDALRRDEVLQPVRQADIIVAAVGCAEVVKSDWVKLGATVVDVGINGS